MFCLTNPSSSPQPKRRYHRGRVGDEAYRPLPLGNPRIDGFRIYVKLSFPIRFPAPHGCHLPSYRDYPPSLTSSLSPSTVYHGVEERKSPSVFRAPPSSHPLAADASSNGQTQSTNQQRFCEHNSKPIPISHSKEPRLRRKHKKTK